MSRASFLESFWEVFGVLEVNFGGLRENRNSVKNSSKLRGFPGTPGSETTRQVEGKMLVQGGTLTTNLRA